MIECKFVPSVCSYCGVGCGVILQVMDGKIVHTLPLKTHPVSQGRLCIKGWNLHEFAMSERRLKTPLIRENGEFRTASWDEALETAASRLKQIIEKYGPASIGVLCSAKITTEENYLAQKFTRAVLGTNNIDHCARL